MNQASMNQTSRDWRLPLLATACAGLTFLLFQGAGTKPLRAQGESRYQVAVMKNVMIGMRDGIKLSTDIYRPARNGAAIEGRA